MTDSDAEVRTSSTSEPFCSPTRTFSEAIAVCFAGYFDFYGRASRSEYWWFCLFTILMQWAALVVDAVAIGTWHMTYSWMVTLACFFPGIAVAARRLHDTNRSGWWQLLVLTIIGIIPLIIWLASRSKNKKNVYNQADCSA